MGKTATAKVIPIHKTREVDVVVRKSPGYRDLRDQVGILFIDSRPSGEVYEVTFEPFYQKLKNVVIEVAAISENAEQLSIIDADDGRTWTFEVNEIEEWSEEEEDDDEEEWPEEDEGEEGGDVWDDNDGT